MSRNPSIVEVNRGYLDHFRRWTSTASRDRGRIVDRLLYGRPMQVLCMPLLALTAVGVWLRLLLWRAVSGRRPLPPLHRRALDFVDEFDAQYPLHLYPIVAKSLELAFLRKRVLDDIKPGAQVLEIAIGDGTLSRRVFDVPRAVTAVDLSPYDLVKAAKLPHVEMAVVCDGLDPPFADGSFDAAIANNFLHHVTQKAKVLRAWAQLADRLIFTENTRAWATGWTIPYLLRRFGFSGAADRVADRIEQRSLQSLLTLEETQSIVDSAVDIVERQTFLSERTFFYCSAFSFFLRCYGPPTPALFKKIALGPMKWAVLPATRSLARLLIEFDAAQDRRRDAFIEFVCQARRPVVPDHRPALICPACRDALSVAYTCSSCGTQYPSRDGALFLLPRDLWHVFEQYRPEVAAMIPLEHL